MYSGNNAAMPKSLSRWWRRVSVLMLSALSACTLQTPFDPSRLRERGSASDVLPVSVTHATLGAERKVFYRETLRVYRSLAAQEGLLAFAIRREVFGNQVWTVTVWASAAARTQFLRSAAHQQAVRLGRAAIQSLRTCRWMLRRDQLPPDWAAVLQMIEPAPRTNEEATDC